jgi:hypothetical protein
MPGKNTEKEYFVTVHVCSSVCSAGYFIGSIYLNREKREISQKRRDRFRVFWRFSWFKIMVPYF